MAKELNWGIISTARINEALIPPIQSSKRNQLQGVASRNLERAQAYAREWNIPKAYGSYQAMLDDPQIDVVYISLPNSLHAEWVIRAAQAGKHVLCEKPLAISLEEVDAIQSAARTAGVVVQEAFMYRHIPQTFKVQELVSSGALGKIWMVHGVFRARLNTPGDVRLDPALGGGSLWDVGCYPLSYARMVLQSEPLQVTGWQQVGETGVDLSFAGQLDFPDEVAVQLDCSFVTPYQTYMEMVGEAATLYVPIPYNPREESSIVLIHDEQQDRIEFPAFDLYSGEVENMADAILEGASPRVSLEDSRSNVAAILALLESARTGLPVKLENH